MQKVIFGVSWDQFLMGAVLLLVLFVGFFHLDTIIGTPRSRGGQPRPPSGQDRQGRPFYSDPDGKPWKRRRRR